LLAFGYKLSIVTLRKARLATFERIIDHAPASFNATQMRLFLRLLIHLDYSFLEEVATHFSNGDENVQRARTPTRRLSKPRGRYRR